MCNSEQPTVIHVRKRGLYRKFAKPSVLLRSSKETRMNHSVLCLHILAATLFFAVQKFIPQISLRLLASTLSQVSSSILKTLRKRRRIPSLSQPDGRLQLRSYPSYNYAVNCLEVDLLTQ